LKHVHIDYSVFQTKADYKEVEIFGYKEDLMKFSKQISIVVIDKNGTQILFEII